MGGQLTQPNIDTPNPEEKKRRRWVILILFLFVFMILTTGFVGYILGKSSRFSDDMTGKAIDTIHVTQPEAKIHLGGKIFYSDGAAYAGGIVQLHSEPRQTVTDNLGAFVFEDAEGGSHTLSIVDEAGNVLAEREVTISREDIEKGAKVKLLQNDAYQVAVAVDIKYLEVQVEINKEDGKLYINPDKVTYLTKEGIVVSPTGKADIKNGVVVTPAGAVITTDGTIICGSGENENRKIIIPSGELANKEDGSIETPDGTQVRTDGTVIHKNTVIDTQGVSMTPDGKTQEPGDGGYQILGDENKIEQIPLGKETEGLIDGGNGQETPGAEDNQGTNADSAGGNNSGGTAGTKPPSNQASGAGTPGTTVPGTNTPDTNTPGTNTPDTNTPGTDTPDIDTPDTPQPPEDTKPNNGAQFAGGTGENQLTAWEQTTEIDLFYNRTAGRDDVTLLAPGAEGYYLFRVSNDNRFSIALDLGVSENELHLPLEFAIADSRGNLLTSWTEAAGKPEVFTDKITLENRGQKIYQIKWRWPYHTSDAGDEADTRIGELDNRSYTVNLRIRAEEL